MKASNFPGRKLRRKLRASLRAQGTDHADVWYKSDKAEVEAVNAGLAKLVEP